MREEAKEVIILTPWGQDNGPILLLGQEGGYEKVVRSVSQGHLKPVSIKQAQP